VNVVTTICMAGLALAGLLFAVRLLRGPSLADRAVALDGLLITVAGGVAVGAARSGSVVFLDVLVVVALLGFVGTVTVARFLERRSS
jgi:multicomponent Na+:H+ antiporter subunit F